MPCKGRATIFGIGAQKQALPLMSNDLAILSSHLSTLIEARSVSQHELDPLVAYAISETQDGRSPDTRRAQWEYLLKHEVFKLAVLAIFLFVDSTNLTQMGTRRQREIYRTGQTKVTLMA